MPFQTNSRKLSGIIPSAARKIRSSPGILCMNLQKPWPESGYRFSCGFRIRYQFLLSCFLFSRALRFSISSTEQYTGFISGCFSSRIRTAVFFPVPGRPIRQTARCSFSSSSIRAVLSMVTFLRFISCYTPFRIPPIRWTRLSASSSRPSII